MTAPNRLSAGEAVVQLGSGALTAEALTRACLDRAEERRDVKAWIWLDPDQALAQARAADQTGRPGLLAWEANRLLGRLPAGVLDTYRIRHEAQARQMFQDAQQTGNWDLMTEVATKFFYTETGQQAANAIGNFHFDRGEFGLASLWYVRLLNSAPPSPPSQDVKWRLKAALAFRESGNMAASSARKKQSSTPINAVTKKTGMAMAPSPASTGPVTPVTRIVPARPITKAPTQLVSRRSSVLTCIESMSRDCCISASLGAISRQPWAISR